MRIARSRIPGRTVAAAAVLLVSTVLFGTELGAAASLGKAAATGSESLTTASWGASASPSTLTWTNSGSDLSTVSNSGTVALSSISYGVTLASSGGGPAGNGVTVTLYACTVAWSGGLCNGGSGTQIGGTFADNATTNATSSVVPAVGGSIYLQATTANYAAGETLTATLNLSVTANSNAASVGALAASPSSLSWAASGNQTSTVTNSGSTSYSSLSYGVTLSSSGGGPAGNGVTVTLHACTVAWSGGLCNGGSGTQIGGTFADNATTNATSSVVPGPNGSIYLQATTASYAAGETLTVTLAVTGNTLAASPSSLSWAASGNQTSTVTNSGSTSYSSLSYGVTLSSSGGGPAGNGVTVTLHACTVAWSGGLCNGGSGTQIGGTFADNATTNATSSVVPGPNGSIYLQATTASYAAGETLTVTLAVTGNTLAASPSSLSWAASGNQTSTVTNSGSTSYSSLSYGVTLSSSGGGPAGNGVTVTLHACTVAWSGGLCNGGSGTQIGGTFADNATTNATSSVVPGPNGSIYLQATTASYAAGETLTVTLAVTGNTLAASPSSLSWAASGNQTSTVTNSGSTSYSSLSYGVTLSSSGGGPAGNGVTVTLHACTVAWSGGLCNGGSGTQIGGTFADNATTNATSSVVPGPNGSIYLQATTASYAAGETLTVTLAVSGTINTTDNIRASVTTNQ